MKKQQAEYEKMKEIVEKDITFVEKITENIKNKIVTFFNLDKGKV